MTTGGIDLSIAALRPVMNGDYKDFDAQSKWSYLLALGALMAVAGATLQLLTNVL